MGKVVRRAEVCSVEHRCLALGDCHWMRVAERFERVMGLLRSVQRRVGRSSKSLSARSHVLGQWVEHTACRYHGEVCHGGSLPRW
jgi:hypothetical protein